MKKSYVAAIGIFVLLYIVPLGIRPIILPDESRYAEIPREMIVSGDWIVPHLDGLRYFEKPVLGYWLNALSIKLFGENAFAVRFPSALATGISAFIVFMLVCRFTGDVTTAIAAALIFSSNFMIPDLTVEHKAPGAFLLRHKDKVKAKTLLVADEDPMGAVCWFYKRNDIYLLEGGGEVFYGLHYEDAKHRSLNLEKFKDLIVKIAGKEELVLVARSEKYARWKYRLPEPMYEDSSGRGGYVFVQYYKPFQNLQFVGLSLL
jgi:hypothetical protein